MKSTVIINGLTLLFFDILLDHFISNISRAHGQVPPCPKVLAPKLFSKVGILGQQYSRAYALQPLHDFAYILRRAVGDEHMNVVAGDLPRDNFKLMLQCNLPENVSCTNSHLPRQHSLSVFRNPYQVDLQVRLSMCAEFVKSHNATTITFSSPEGEGFPPSPRETLKDEFLRGLKKTIKNCPLTLTLVLYAALGLLLSESLKAYCGD